MLKNLTIQLIVFITIFQTLSWIRQTSMLSTDTVISSDIVLNSLWDEPVALAAQDKNLVVYFFAPWCQICHASIDNLQSIYEKHDNLDVIAVALDFTDSEEVEKFVKQHQLTFDVALGNEEIKQRFQITGYPSYYVLDKENAVTGKSLGYSTELGIYLRSL